MPELTPDLLAQLAQQQSETDALLADDCAQLEDILVRLAGPTLQGVEEDSAALAELQVNLAAPTIAQIRRDFLALQRILRKLVAQTDQGISEDTTLLTGIAARVQGSSFPANRGSQTDSGMRAPTGQVGSSGAGGFSRYGVTHPGLEGLGLPGSAQAGSALPQPPAGTTGQTRPAAVSPTRNPLAELAAQEPPPEQKPPGTLQLTPPSLPSLTPTPAGGSGAPTSGPVTPPEPLNGELPSASALPPPPTTGAGLGTAQPPPLPPLPAPVPAAPAPPDKDCNLCDAIRYLVDALRPPLVSIATSLALLTPGAQERHRVRTADAAFEQIGPPLKWSNPPEQRLTDEELEGAYDYDKPGGVDLELTVTSGAGPAGVVSLPATR